MNPKISIVICTYNGESLIENCLNSILNQNINNYEILCVDGGSVDKTKKIIENYSKKDKRIKLLINKNKLPEGYGNGKWLGYKESKGEIIGFIDQDNVLQRKDLFKKVQELFKNEKILGILGGLKHDYRDKSVVRYVSLFGTDSFFAYRSIDFIRSMNKKVGNIEEYKLQSENMCLTGGNCFFYNKKDLNNLGGYSQDVTLIKNFINVLSKNKLLVIPESTKHYAEKNITLLIKKKRYWSNENSINNNIKKFDYLPKGSYERKKFLFNLAFNLLVIPNIYYSIRIYIRNRDFICFYFPFIAFANTFFYSYNFLKSKLINNFINN